jgi:hypothetical protein
VSRGARAATALAGLVVLVGAPAPGRSQPAPAPAAVTQLGSDAVYINRGSDDGLRVDDPIAIAAANGRTAAATVVHLARHSARARLAPDAPFPAVGAAVTLPARPPGTSTAARAPRLTERHLKTPPPRHQLAALWVGVTTRPPQLIRFRTGLRPLPNAGVDLLAAELEPATTRARLALAYAGNYALDGARGAYHRLEMRSDLAVPHALSNALDYAHSARLRLDLAPGLDLRFDDRRTGLRLYRLRLAVRSSAVTGSHLELGRIAGAPAPDAGLVDGAAVRTRLTDTVYVGAFGGAAPTLDDLALTGEAARFGIYGSYRPKTRQGLYAALDVAGLGSTFAGTLDRRATTVRAHVSGWRAWAHSEIVVDQFGAGHPARNPALGRSASPVDLSRAAVDLGGRPWSWLRASVRIDRVRALRTREVLARLPASYASGTAYSGASASLDARLPGVIDLHTRAGYRAAAAEVDAAWIELGASVTALGLADDRASASALASFGTYYDLASLRARYQLPIHSHVLLESGYRLSFYRYDDENRRLWTHAPSLAVDAGMRLGPRLRGTASLAAEAELGTEHRGLFTIASIAAHWL